MNKIVDVIYKRELEAFKSKVPLMKRRNEECLIVRLKAKLKIPGSTLHDTGDRLNK